MLIVDFINVGYGDSILIRMMKDDRVEFTMLVDCGDVTLGKLSAQSKRIKAIDFLKREGIRKVDLLVITHLHLDHTGGLPDLAEEIEIDTVWVNYLPQDQFFGKVIEGKNGLSSGARNLLSSLNIYLRSLKTLQRKGVKIQLQDKNDRQYELGEALKAELFIEEELLALQDRIWEETLSGSISDIRLNELDHFINNTSIRMRITYAGRSIELPGDIYARRWERHRVPQSDIVKIPHHGHEDSMTPKLAAMLQPEYAVVSVSDSRSDCPSPGAIGLVKHHSQQLLFTDAVKRCGFVPQYHNTVSFRIDEGGSISQSYQ